MKNNLILYNTGLQLLPSKALWESVKEDRFERIVSDTVDVLDGNRRLEPF